MTDFKPGQKVRAIRDTESLYGTKVAKGQTGTVEDEWANPSGRFVASGAAPWNIILPKADFEAVEETVKCSFPLADGYTLVWANSGIEVRVTETTPDVVVFEWANGAQGQLPWSEVWNYLQPAPKPEVEWKPGTVYDVDGERYWYAGTNDDYPWVGDQGDETLVETVQRYVSREWKQKTGSAIAPEPEWKPGDVAELVFSDGTVRAIRNEDGEWAASDGSLYTDGGHADFRPLVVIDPADISRAVVADVAAKAYRTAPWGRNAFVDVAESILNHLGLTKEETLAEAWADGFNSATDAVPGDVWFDVWDDVDNPYKEEK